MSILDMVWQDMEQKAKEQGDQPSIIEEAVIVPYNRFNSQGLNVFSKFFKRKGYTVTDIKADDKVRKKDGMPTKKAIFEFENGQKLEILLAFEAKGKKSIDTAMGSIFIAKVDGKKIPVSAGSPWEKHTSKALKKIVEFLLKSAPDKTKTEQERKKLLAASSADLKPDQVRGPRSTAAKLKSVMARQEELTNLLGISQAQIKEEKADNKSLTAKHSQLEKKLAGLTDTEASLQQELATLQAA